MSEEVEGVYMSEGVEWGVSMAGHGARFLYQW